MSLRLICGRAGTGKSEFCLEEIKNNLDKNRKIYIITPEQYSFTEEKKLIAKIENGSTMQVEVLTFARMAYRLLNEVGGATRTNLSKAGKAMLIYDILEKNKKNLCFLGKSKQNVELIDTMLTEFKKHKIQIKDLNDVKTKIENAYLEKKLEDVIKIYEEYNKSLEGKYIEENDKLEILSLQLEKTDLYKGCIFYIDEFTGFTKQEYEIISKLIKIAYKVNITITTDNLDMGQNISQDLFYFNKQTADKLLYLAKSNNIECEKTVFLDNVYRFKNKELKHLEENIEKIPFDEYKEEVKNISIEIAKNPYEEVENVAKEIIKLVKKEGYRYKDIIVISKEIDKYSALSKAIFNLYEIPIFIDEKKSLNQNLFAKYILALLEIFSSNWSYEAVIQYLKTGFIEIEDETIYEFENYARKLGIKGKKWYKEDWKIFGDEEKIQYMNEVRREKLLPLVDLKEKLSESKTVDSMNIALYEFLVSNNIEGQLKKKQEIFEQKGNLELAKEQEAAWNIVISIFEEMNGLFKNKKISFTNYRELLKIALTENGLGLIPQTQDQVIIGDVNRTKAGEVKAIFILGVNDGIFPSIRKDEGFLNDNDREILKNNEVELAKGTLENLYEERFSIYKVLTTETDKLYISYCSLESEGKALRPSTYITKIRKIFPKLKEKSNITNEKFEIINETNTFEELINNLRRENEGEKIDDIWYSIEKYFEENPDWKDKLEQAKRALYLKEQPKELDKENIKKLYGNTLQTSVSRLEQYQACPFSYYLKYGLKLKEQEEYKIKSIDTGTFMHEIIDSFFNVLREKGIEIKEAEDDELYKIIDELINEKLGLPKYYIFTSNEKFNVLTEKLKKVVFQSMKYLIEGLKESDFKVLGNELEFKRGKEYKPIELDLEDGKKVEITGKIDRIDIAKVGNDNYIRIIDYKSYVTNIDLNEVVAGLQIQLLTYLDAAAKIENMIPAGMLYYNLIDPILKSDTPISKEKLEEELKKKFKMNGLILADINIIKLMDKSLDKGNSNIIPVYIDKDGNISKSKSSAINKEQFQDLINYTNKIIKDISSEILNGNIEIKPYYQRNTKRTACDLCSYASICEFKQKKLPYKYIDNCNKEEILNRIKNIE